MSETWITLVDSDVLPQNSRERQAVTALKGLDDLADICVQVTNQIREAWQSGGQVLGPLGTIPDGMQDRAVAIALWRYINRLPKNDNIQTPARRGNYDDAKEYLMQISTRKVTGSGGAQIARGGPRRATRRQTDGL